MTAPTYIYIHTYSIGTLHRALFVLMSCQGSSQKMKSRMVYNYTCIIIAKKIKGNILVDCHISSKKNAIESGTKLGW